MELTSLEVAFGEVSVGYIVKNADVNSIGDLPILHKLNDRQILATV